MSKTGEMNGAAYSQVDVFAAYVDNRSDKWAAENSSENIATKALADQKQASSRSDKSLTPDLEKDNINSAMDPLPDVETPGSCKDRKRKFNESDLGDSNNGSLPPQDPSATCVSKRQKRPSLGRPSSSFLANDDTSDNTLVSDTDAGNNTCNRPTILNSPRSLDHFRGEADKGGLLEPNWKYLTNEKGQMWRYVGMRRGRNGRMRRKYVRQWAHGSGKIWTWAK